MRLKVTEWEEEECEKMGEEEQREGGEREMERKCEFISESRAIMESLCLVKSHEISRVKAGVYSTAGGRDLLRPRRSDSMFKEISGAEICVYEKFGWETEMMEVLAFNE